MPSNFSRKDLKTDKFAVEVEHTVDFFALHRSEVIRYGAIALAVMLLAVGIYYYRAHQHTVREEKLAAAMQVQEAQVSSAASPTGALTFPTEDAKRAEAQKAFTKVATEEGGSEEGYIAEYYLASMAADQGKLDEAKKRFQMVSDNAAKNFSSLAKLSIAQIAFSENRTSDGEKILRALMDKPTELVSKEQATFTLARNLTKSNPAEARKLLNGLVKTPGSVSQVATGALADLGQ